MKLRTTSHKKPLPKNPKSGKNLGKRPKKHQHPLISPNLQQRLSKNVQRTRRHVSILSPRQSPGLLTLTFGVPGFFRAACVTRSHFRRVTGKMPTCEMVHTLATKRPKGYSASSDADVSLAVAKTLQFHWMERLQDNFQEVFTPRRKQKPFHKFQTHFLRSSHFFRYASLFFITCVDKNDNELIALEVIHEFVEVLDRYFGNVPFFRLFFSVAFRCFGRAKFECMNEKHAPFSFNENQKFMTFSSVKQFQVCELDLIFNFHKAYYILDELIIAGEHQESSKKAILRVTGPCIFPFEPPPSTTGSP